LQRQPHKGAVSFVQQQSELKKINCWKSMGQVPQCLIAGDANVPDDVRRCPKMCVFRFCLKVFRDRLFSLGADDKLFDTAGKSLLCD